MPAINLFFYQRLQQIKKDFNFVESGYHLGKMLVCIQMMRYNEIAFVKGDRDFSVSLDFQKFVAAAAPENGKIN